MYTRLAVLIISFCTAFACHATSYIMVLGDSLSAGYGLPDSSQSWVGLLADRLKQNNLDYTVVNNSVSGETSAEALQKVPQELEVTNPQLVIIALGSNDGLRDFPILDIRITLSKIIELVQAKPAKALLIGFKLPYDYGADYRAAFEQIFVDVSTKYSIPLVPFLLDGFAQDPSYFQADHLHPTAAAQPLMLENVWKYLAPMLKPS